MNDNGTVLFHKDMVRGQLSETSDDDNADDIWDDRLLIEAYDRAVNFAKEKVAASSGETNEVAAGVQVDPKNQEGKPKGPESKWKEGMFCRCVYSGDNQEYEATVKSLSPAKGTCRVVYHGYNNEEEVQLSNLKRSKGEKARKAQIIQSQSPPGMQQDESSDSNNRHSDYPGGFPSMEFHNSSRHKVLPPPPPPQIMSHFPKDESDALSAMLMAWYMSGYHTGYYQGLTRSRPKDKASSSYN